MDACLQAYILHRTINDRVISKWDIGDCQIELLRGERHSFKAVMEHCAASLGIWMQVSQNFGGYFVKFDLDQANALLGANWTLYVFLVNSGPTLDASLGYFLNPLLSVAARLILFRSIALAALGSPASQGGISSASDLVWKNHANGDNGLFAASSNSVLQAWQDFAGSAVIPPATDILFHNTTADDSHNTGAPLAKALIAPCEPTASPRSAEPAITGCSVSPEPEV